MSISNLFEPNDYNLFCNDLTANNLNFGSSSISILDITNPPASAATDDLLTIDNTGSVNKSSIQLQNVVTLSDTQTLTNKTLTSAILTTPNLGTPSALILTNATGDQLGTSIGGNAASGHVGEYFSQTELIGASQPLSTGVTSNVFPVQNALSPGDWDIYGTVAFNPNVATTSSQFIVGLSGTSTTLPTIGADNNYSQLDGTFSAGQTVVLNIGPVRSSSAFIQNIFLVAQSTFSINTMSVYGCMTARRIR